MKTEKLVTTLYDFKTYKNCPKAVQELFEKSIEARDNAYAPYSNFKVGVAILLEGGTIITGNNQENAAYPSGLCAERTAIYYAGALHPHKKIHTIVVTAGLKDKENIIPVPPCGACRQAIAEYELKQKSPIEIYFMGTSGHVKMVKSILDILPLSFSKDFLE